MFMLGAVNRVFHPGCKFDLMLVLVGGQGAGKSTFLRFLAVKDEWFTDDIRKLDDENIYRRIMSHWIVEMSEMVATANARSIEEIKSFLSRSKDTYKVPYDRFPADRPRQCVFAGTTNEWIFCPWTEPGTAVFCQCRYIQREPTSTFSAMKPHPAPTSTSSGRKSWCSTAPAISARTSAKAWNNSSYRNKPFFRQEDTLAGQIIGFMENYPGDKLCSKQIYCEALRHPYDEPRTWETREICEVVNLAIAGGELPGWRAFTSPKRFPKYGTQRGWERIPKACQQARYSPGNLRTDGLYAD